MDMSRRKLTVGLTAATGLAATGKFRLACAAAYPSSTIHCVIGFPPGGVVDFGARVVAELMARRLKQSVVVESRTGADSQLALQYVARAAPDGYTLTVANEDATAMLSAERKKIPYDIAKDFTYIARFAQLGFVVVVNSKLPIKSIAELVSYAKANPGKLRYGSVGIGSAMHVTGLLFEQQAGVKLTHIPYRGGSAVLTNIFSGIIEMGFLTLANLAGNTSSDKIRLLAVTAAAREPSLPGVPTLAEVGYRGATMSNWLGVMGPAHLPGEVTERLIGALRVAVTDPQVKQRFATVGLKPALLTGGDFRKLVINEYHQWRAVVKNAHLVIE